MKQTILTPDTYRQMPWKNGGGTTCEILREPADISQPFNWRLSIADIKENGPFSLFQGYSRIINTLEGEGMRLTVDGRTSGDLKQYQPFAFQGESAVHSELLNGPIRDFNLIYRTGAYKARFEWRNTPAAFMSQATHILVYTVEAINVNGTLLPPAHTLYTDNPAMLPQAIAVNTQTPGYYCTIEL